MCRVKKILRGTKGTPCAVTHDGRTIRYPDPNVKTNDTLRLDITTGKVLDYLKFEAGNTVMISGGKNIGRVGTLIHRERHPGSFGIVHMKDTVGHSFTTRLNNVFVIGKDKPWISLPNSSGVKLSILEDSNLFAMLFSVTVVELQFKINSGSSCQDEQVNSRALSAG